MSFPETCLSLGARYLELGGCVALAFAAYGVARVEPAAKGGSWLFRLLIVPGATLLWPLVLLRWLRALRTARDQRRTS